MNLKPDLSSVVLRTERLTLRAWRQEDLEDLYEYASVDGVGQMAGWKPHESLAESQQILEHFIEGRKTFALEHRGKVIGSLGIERYIEAQFPELDDKQGCILGYVLSKDYWGRGLMPEAVRAVIRYIFAGLGADFILCGHFLRNKRSERVQEKCGFRHYLYDQFQTKLGTVEDDEIKILTREDWLAGGGK